MIRMKILINPHEKETIYISLAAGSIRPGQALAHLVILHEASGGQPLRLAKSGLIL